LARWWLLASGGPVHGRQRLAARVGFVLSFVAGALAMCMLSAKGRGRNAFGGLARSTNAMGRAGPSMRPGSSQIRGNGAGGLGLSSVAARLAADEDPVPAGRAKRLDVALAGVA